MESAKQESTALQKKERISYWVYFLGQNIFYGLVAINMQTFFTDVGITLTSIAAIMLFTKIWDAVNDPILGVIIDKVHFKSGRFLPWIRISFPLIFVSSVFFFLLPNQGSPVVKVVWATVGYVAWSMSYTLCDVPIFVLPTSMTDDVRERNQLLTIGRFFAMIGVTVSSVSIPILQARFGWLAVGIIFTIVACIAMFPLLVNGKERHFVRREKSITLKQMLNYVIKNKYLIIFYGALLMSGLLNFTQYIQIYFARICLGNQDLASIISLLSLLPLLISGIAIPIIIKKVDKFAVYLTSNIIAALIGIVLFFIGYSNLTVFFIMMFIQGFFTGANNILLFTFTPDCIEYGTYHTGERAEGMAASVQTFFSKLVGSISGPIAMLILAGFGFVTGEGAIQPPSVAGGVWILYTLGPAVGMILAVITLQFYKLRTADVQIMAQYNTNKISKDEAEKLLKAKFGEAAELER